MATKQRKDILCDLCEDEQALSFCGQCMWKLGEFCKLAHTRQKRTKDHSLADIESVKLLYLNVSCSLCNGQSERFCQECEACLCTKCADSHHKLSDVQTSTAHTNTLRRDDSRSPYSHNDSSNTINQLRLTASESGVQNTDNYHVTDNQGCDQVAGCSKMLAKDNYMFSTFKDGRETMIERPGKPTVIRLYMDSVDIIWTGLHDFRKGDVYQVRIENTITGKLESQDFETNSGKITRLQQGTTYVFKVRLVCSSGDESLFSENSDEVMTHTSYASKIISKSVLVKTGTNGPDLYRLPMIERIEARTEYLKKFDIGPVGIDINEKTIMLVGATGTGKSTFVDAIANYVMGVKLEDTFRFTVMLEDRAKQQDQAVTNTEIITCYSFNSNIGTVHSGRLNVVDTPGFGDKRGPERDEAIVKLIQKLFDSPGEKGIQMIDAICIFIKAPDARLTPTQRYILNAIMSMFGNDIAGNMCTMITFNDGDSDPLVMDAVKESGLPFGKEFTFNNLAFTADPKSGITSKFWDQNLDSFSRMFTHLDTLETKCMQLTTVVLKERQVLTLICQKLVISIKAGISTIQNLKKELKLFEQNQDDINKNKNYTYEVTEVRMVKQTGYAYDLLEEKVRKTYDEMLKRYQEAKGKQLTLQQIVKERRKELVIITAEIESMLEQMKTCNNRLKEISLRPNPLGLKNQLDLMIMTEESEGKEGYQKRIEVLKEFRERAAIDELVQTFKTEESSVTVRYIALLS